MLTFISITFHIRSDLANGTFTVFFFLANGDIAFFIHLVKIRHFDAHTMKGAWQKGYNVEDGTIGSGFVSRWNYCCVSRVLEDIMRMFALKPCIAVRVGAAMPV